MRIFINDILTSSKTNFLYKFELDKDCCEISGRKAVFNEKPTVVCEITKTEDNNLHAKIDIHLDTVINCVRCLDSMQASDDVTISGIISDHDDDVDYDMIIVDDDYLDIDKILEDAVFEHLNNNLYCNENCKGLCHNCGANLNKTTCKCQEKDLSNIDPRLEKLKTFLD